MNYAFLVPTSTFRTCLCSELGFKARSFSRGHGTGLKCTPQSKRLRRNIILATTNVDDTRSSSGTAVETDDGPPLRYDRQLLEQYWSRRTSELNQRYLAFAATAAPFIGSVLKHFATRTLTRDDVIAQLAFQAREGMEALGPTYVKMGQMMSIRPDVIPEPAMRELQKLQDGVSRFDNQVARQIIEDELGQSLESIFSEFSDEPIAAASLAQVYRARLRQNGIEVAVKVQRPEALTLCSKDMYVLQRAVGVYQGIMQRWTAQNVDYNALLESFASGFYEELDFELEARNQERARLAVLKAMQGRVYVPKVYFEHCTRRVLVTEFVYGTKLTECEPDELRRLTAIGQECFLNQLLEPGQFLHADPHGGNLLKPDVEATAAAAAKAKCEIVKDESTTLPAPAAETDLLVDREVQPELLLLDFGLTASVPDEDKPKLVLGIVHMANRDWAAVTEDFVALGFLPDDIDRKKVSPLLERVLAPYVTGGGGAKAFMGDGVFSASFQGLMRDLSQAAVEIPFSIPSYWPIIGRSVAILEGIALTGDPNYKIVLSSYPYVTRKLLKENEEESFSIALNAILYPRGQNGARQPRPSPRRIVSLINNALGRAAVASDSSAMLDLEAMPNEGDAATLTESVAFLGREDATAIRSVLLDELVCGADLLLRQAVRQIASTVQGVSSVRLPAPSIPFLPQPRIPVFNPMTLVPEKIRDDLLDKVAPPLSIEENVYANDISELLKSLLGLDIEDVTNSFRSPSELLSFISPVLSKNLPGSRGGFGLHSARTQGAGDRTELVDLLLHPVLPKFLVSASSDRQVSNEIVTDASNALRSIGKEMLERLQNLQMRRLTS